MWNYPVNYRQQKLPISLLLAILLFQVYVPAGFMPASSAPFLLEICPVGLPAQMLAYHAHHHGGIHDQFEHCPFGSAPAPEPIATYAHQFVVRIVTARAD
jgi:hypothetical protein